MKIEVDREKCTALGICESLADEFFEVGDDGELVVLQSEVPDDQVALVRRAVAGCPTVALSLVET